MTHFISMFPKVCIFYSCIFAEKIYLNKHTLFFNKYILYTCMYVCVYICIDFVSHKNHVIKTHTHTKKERKKEREEEIVSKFYIVL